MYLVIEVINRDINVSRVKTLIEAQRYLQEVVKAVLCENKHIDFRVDDSFLHAWVTQDDYEYDWRIINTDQIRDLDDPEIFIK